jgi:predicted Zn-dependent protease
MNRTVRLYWQKWCAEAVPAVTQTLREHFPVNVIPAAALEPTILAFDTARGQYDAVYLLRELPEYDLFRVFGSIELPLAIWLVNEDISYTNHDYLYGATLRNLAVVSAARTGFGENLHKEVCHETGHLFGLEHCRNACVMSTSSERRQLAAKPLQLCSVCYGRVTKQ